MKLLVNVFERARSKLTITRSNNHFLSGLLNTFNYITIGVCFFLFIDSDIEITKFDSNGS